MKKYLKGIKSSYFVFYAITYCGSALTSVSSFLMIEKIFGSISDLGLALALKTAFIALASPLVASKLAKLSMKSSFWISQILGILFLLPLYAGVRFGIPWMFVFGITIGGLSTLILNIVGTTYLKISSAGDGSTFRLQQGKLQLVIGICFTLCSLLSPLLLKYLDYDAVLLIDFLSYALGVLYIFANRTIFDRWEKPTFPNKVDEISSSDSVSKGAWSKTSISFALIAGSAYSLKGLAPMLSANSLLTQQMDISLTSRQSLWAFEAIAGIIGGMVYKKHHSQLGQTVLFKLGLFSAAMLIPIILLPFFWTLAICVFVLSVTMLLTFMKFRDDFLARFSSKEETVWAAGFVNLVSNAIMTISPLLIILSISHFSLNTSIGIALAIQMVIYLGVRLIGKEPSAA